MEDHDVNAALNRHWATPAIIKRGPDPKGTLGTGQPDAR
jgi:hypothetical protein